MSQLPMAFIPELKECHKNYKDLKRELNKRRKELERLFKKFSFVTEIVNPKVNDLDLERYVADLFGDLGYNSKNPPEKRDFDVIAVCKGTKIGIEVKNDRHIGENEMFQAKKYATRYRAQGKIVHPLVVWNNAKENHQFDVHRIGDALGNEYGIITTVELLKGYSKVKKGIISFDLFHRMITRFGLIQFSKKSIKDAERSEVP